ncbi:MULTISPECIES: nucleoside-binding protein [unclassified Pseudoalteromonas]|uniref:nucleoside-binding protein n=1 Tax=unclassified Pseudoalteromonas TaxID=194690 RepID=UPI0018CF44C0|nr:MULTISPECIES: nucleoside-binding protein [unclassified Pseudoalteromonas]MBH0051391.1 nucleoside-binding protein [Pseudoalteromonas sp. SWYJZ19]MBH0074702.1 nucleoside-binding protein [Pseudoalteromonas sp. SWYJ118]
MKFKKLLPFITLTSLALSSSAFAANWSSTAVHINNGSQKNPFSKQESDTTVYSIQHASGHDYGDNFFFIDYSKDDTTDGYQDSDFYGEWYSTVSLSAITGKQIGSGALLDVGLTGGINVAGDAKVMKYLPGVKLSWDVPGFNFFQTLVTAYIDDSEGVAKGGAPIETNSWMLDVAFEYPFTIGSQKFSFKGHAEYIAEREDEFGNDVEAWILAQPILVWDMGHSLQMKENTLLLGMELQYWHNKLGTEVTESVPQIHVEWTF